nr:variable surface lipoprotein [Mycoplasmopsis bovis]
MKKSKFLLLGSVASLASIPFVAAKCGETKEEEKKKPEALTKNQVEIKTLEENKTPGEGTDQAKTRWR